MDILGRALAEHYFEDKDYKLWVHDLHGPKVEMPIPIYFRDPASMPELELTALDLCKGDTLDIGAGAGSHALYLQHKQVKVSAIDISEGAVAVMKDRGVQDAFVQDVFALNGIRYDTLLLLMNGIGLVQDIQGLRLFLRHAETLLTRGGQLLFDSSDVAYLYEDGKSLPDYYYGEVKCCYEYRRQKSEWFSWLYIDRNTLSDIAAQEGWYTEIITEDESGQYLARLTILQ